MRGGRVTIPKKVGDSLRIGRKVRMRVERDRIIIEPIEDPLEGLSDLVKSSNVSSDRAEEMGRVASEYLFR